MPIMIFESTDPYLNLAIEEVLFEEYDLTEDLFLIWFSKPAFIVGRNQNAFLEVNPKYKDIPVIRRISGGGTIYQDLNTLNFSFITKNYKDRINQYQYFLNPIIDSLKSLGVDSKFKPKSHLVVDDKKISGNAQAFKHNRLLHHGTLLINANLNIIEHALLQYNPKSFGSQVASNKQTVVNISDYLPESCEIDDVVRTIIDHVTKDFNITKRIVPIDLSFMKKALTLAEKKYQSWEWNYGKTPVFHIQVNDCFLKVEKGCIVEASLNDYQDLLGIQFESTEYHKKLNEHKKTA